MTSHVFQTQSFYRLRQAIHIAILFVLPLSSIQVMAQWTTRAAATARWGASACELGGYIYLVGGNNGGDLGTFQRYDPGTNTWTTLASMPTPRAYPAAVGASNGRIYVFGGAAGSTWLNVVEEYNPGTNTWSARAPMPVNSMGLGAAEAGGKIYVVGGWNGILLNANQEYDFATNTWAARAVLPVARYQISCAALGGLVYAVGGYTSAPVGTTNAYNPATNTWSTLTSMITSRYLHGVSAQDGFVYAMGGWPNTGTTERYNPATNLWQSQPNLTQARYRITSAATSTCVYALGGFTGSVTVGTNEELCNIVLDENSVDLNISIEGASAFLNWQTSLNGIREHLVDRWTEESSWETVHRMTPSGTGETNHWQTEVSKPTLFRITSLMADGAFSHSQPEWAIPVQSAPMIHASVWHDAQLLTLEFETEANSDAWVRLSSLDGKELAFVKVDATIPGMNTVQIPFQGLPNGLYLVQVFNGKQVISSKVLL